MGHFYLVLRHSGGPGYGYVARMASGRSPGEVVVVGSVNVDHTARVDRLPAAGETVLSRSYTIGAGGKGANQAVTAARLQAPTVLIGTVGDDPAGADLAERLAGEGVDVALLHRASGAATGVALITVDDAGANTIVVGAQANALLLAEQIDDAVGVIASAAVLMAQLEIPLAVVTRAFELARGAGVTTIFNASPAPPAPRLSGVLPLVDVLVVNHREAEVLTGLADAAAAARRLVSLGPQSAIVTQGGAGAVWWDGAVLRTVAPFPVEEVDGTAAGDAFCGALAAALASGRGLAEGLEWAAAAGAAAAARPGALASLPTRAEVADRLVNGRGG
jgi:ribokinase